MPDTVLRCAVSAAAHRANESQDPQAQCTLRLVQAALRDRDEAARIEGRARPGDDEVTAVLLCMLRQREMAAETLRGEGDEAGSRAKTAAAALIRDLLPAAVSRDELEEVCRQVVSDTGSRSLRDVGRCMNALRGRFPDPDDLVQASGVVRGLLA